MSQNDESTADDGQPPRKRYRPADGASNGLDPSEISSQVSGKILRVVVKNFMCHDNLDFAFTPNINFVQGRNGSGKSAILTAVVVGLGGQTRSTNRGHSLKDLVKYGKHSATLEITLQNNGRESYKKDLYGESITVERKIVTTGAGGYRIKSADGRTISTRKDELQRILDFFNLQVENPITILNQDMSRSFLQTTEPRDLYKFFLKATQLQQMKQDYSELERSLQISDTIVKDRQGCLPGMKTEMDDWEKRYQIIMSLETKREKLRELRRELAWAQVITKEKKVDELEKNVSQYDAQNDNLKEKMGKINEKKKEEEALFKEIQEKFTSLMNHMKTHRVEENKGKDLEKKTRKNHKDAQGEVVAWSKDYQKIVKEKKELEKAIQTDHTGAWSNWTQKRNERLAKIEKLKGDKLQITQECKTEDTHQTNLQNTLDQKKAEQDQYFQEEKAIISRSNSLQEEIRKLAGQNQSQSTIYGQWVPQVLDEIEKQQHRFSKKPIGPLGSYIKMHDPKWGHVIEQVVGGQMHSFCCNNSQDSKILDTIITRFLPRNMMKPMVIVSRFRDAIHDVSKYEVQSPDYPSLWSILNVSNVCVANTLIDQCKVESILLIPTPEEAGEIMKSRDRVPRNCQKAMTLQGDQYFPDPNFKIYSGQGIRPTKFLQVSVEDKVDALKKELVGHQRELQNFKGEYQGLKQEVMNLSQQVKESRGKLARNKTRVNALNAELIQLENADEPQPADVTTLEEEINELDEKLSNIQNNIDESKAKVEETKEKVMEAMKNNEEIGKQNEKRMEETEEQNELINAKQDLLNKLVKTLDAVKKKLENASNSKKELEKEYKVAKNSLDQDTKKATANWERFDTRRSVEDLERQFKSLEARLSKEEQQQGDPVEVGERLRELKTRYHEVSKELESHANIIKKISESLHTRREQYKHFRRFLSIIIKSNFSIFLDVRKLKGNIQFDFDRQALTLNVLKPSNEEGAKAALEGASQTTKTKKVAVPQSLAMMSGGERSFATVSFIMALWDAMDAPVRVLDEFDVFMDIVSRRQSMDLMISSAKPRTQYIFLTPLEIEKNKKKNICIYRMPDPERNENN